MCVVCAEFAKGKLTVKEAKRALFEMVNSDSPEDVDHFRKVYADLDDQDKFTKGDPNGTT